MTLSRLLLLSLVLVGAAMAEMADKPAAMLHTVRSGDIVDLSRNPELCEMIHSLVELMDDRSECPALSYLYHCIAKGDGSVHASIIARAQQELDVLMSADRSFGSIKQIYTISSELAALGLGANFSTTMGDNTVLVGPNFSTMGGTQTINIGTNEGGGTGPSIVNIGNDNLLSEVNIISPIVMIPGLIIEDLIVENLTADGTFMQFGGDVSINDDAADAILDFGTGDAAKTVTIGSANTTSSTVVQAGTGDLMLTSTDALTLDSVGVLELNSSGAAISIGNDAVAQNINIGTAGMRMIEIGSAMATVDFNGSTVAGLTLIADALSSTTDVTITTRSTNVDGTSRVLTFDSSTAQGGLPTLTQPAGIELVIGDATGASALTLQAGTGDLMLTSTGALTLDSAGLLELNSSGAAISIGNNDDDFGINIGTAGTRMITIGSGMSTVDFNGSTVVGLAADALSSTMDVTITTRSTSAGGTSQVFTFDSSTAQGGLPTLTQPVGVELVIGDATGASALTLQAGTGDLALTSTDALTLDSAGVLELNSSAGVISIGNDTVAQNINIGTAGARTIEIGSAMATVDFNGSTVVGLTLSASALSSTTDVTITTRATTGTEEILTFDSVVNAIPTIMQATGSNLTIGSITGASALTLQAGSGTAAGDLVLTTASDATNGIININNNATTTTGNRTTNIGLNISTAAAGTAMEIVAIANNTGTVSAGAASSVAPTTAVTIANDSRTITQTMGFTTTLPSMTHTIFNEAPTLVASDAGAIINGSANPVTVDIGGFSPMYTGSVAGSTGTFWRNLNIGMGTVVGSLATDTSTNIITIGNVTNATGLGTLVNNVDIATAAIASIITVGSATDGSGDGMTPNVITLNTGAAAFDGIRYQIGAAGIPLSPVGFSLPTAAAPVALRVVVGVAQFNGATSGLWSIVSAGTNDWAIDVLNSGPTQLVLSFANPPTTLLNASLTGGLTTSFGGATLAVPLTADFGITFASEQTITITTAAGVDRILPFVIYYV